MIEIWKLTSRHEDAALSEGAGGAGVCAGGGVGGAAGANNTDFSRLRNGAGSAANSNLCAGVGGGENSAGENLAGGGSNSNLDDVTLTERHKAVIRFSTCIGHGVGTIDFSSKVAEFSEGEWAGFLEGAGEWARQKLGNVNRYFEIEVSLPQAVRAAAELPPSPLRDLLASLREGYFTIRKSSFC